MSKKWITIGIILLAVFLLYNSLKGMYNNMVETSEKVKTAWSDVETQYQRRYDLIPNLVNTVKGFAEQEREVLTGVTEARSRASSIQIDPANLDENTLQQFQQAQGQLNSALSRLLVTVERYPDLKSNQNFLELQSQLEGTENRIAISRQRFNAATQDYNILIQSFPEITLAGLFGFEQKPLFEADQGAESAPKVEF